MNTVMRSMLVGVCIVAMVPSVCRAKKEHTHNPYAAGVAEDTRSWNELWQALETLEASGGENEQLKINLCGKAITILDELRNKVLDRYPALKQRKVRADVALRKISRALRLAKQGHPTLTVAEGTRKSMSRRIKQLESDKRKVLYKLELIEDELEALLHNDEALSKKFNKVHDLLVKWCD
jgi:hypothetical protein